MATAAPLDLFVCHSSVDVDIVEPLVDLLQVALNLEPDRIRATSIDGYRLMAGIPFEQALRRETHDALAFIGVISLASLGSTYVAFELGSRWGANRHLVPLLTAEVAPSDLEGPLAALNTIRIDDRAQMQQLIADLAAELNKQARPPHQYARQLERLLTAAGRSRSTQPRSDPTHRAEPWASDVDYAPLVERFDMLMEVQRQAMERDPEQPIEPGVRAKLQATRDAIGEWLRANRLRADPEIAEDADRLLEMHREEWRAFLAGAGVAFPESPRAVFKRLVERVRSSSRPAAREGDR